MFEHTTNYGQELYGCQTKQFEFYLHGAKKLLYNGLISKTGVAKVKVMRSRRYVFLCKFHYLRENNNLDINSINFFLYFLTN